MNQQEAFIWAMASLCHLFVPDRIPDIIERPAPIFDGATAMDWILDGRGDDVVKAYEKALDYMN